MSNSFSLIESFEEKYHNQKFSINIYSHNTGFYKIIDFYAWIQYDVFNNSTSNAIMKSKQFVSSTADDISQQCKNWIKQNSKGE